MKCGLVFFEIVFVSLFFFECHAENIFKKVGNAIGSAATSVASKVSDVASDVKDKVEEKVEEVKERIEDKKDNSDNDDNDDDKDDDDDDESGEKNSKKGKSNANVPILSEADSKERMTKLKENARNMKDKEQSTENKLLGAAAIGATGIGGMNLLSGTAEQKADENAEHGMQGYLASFWCDYGGGKQVKYGDFGIELPVENMSELIAEYRALAQDLKNRKDALGAQPGIEADLIIDSADAGLYDSYSQGKTTGAFTSVARALMDKDSADAVNWEKQKSDTASKVKTATITVAVASVGAIATDMAINNHKDKKNKSDEIMNEYESKKGSR